MSKRRQRRLATLGVLVVLLIVAGVVGGSNGAGTTRPAGKWGKLIACLQAHPTFLVLTAGTGNNVTTRTTSVFVENRVSGRAISYLADMQLGSDGFTGSGEVNVNEIAGPIEYGFGPKASAADQVIVTGCVQSSGVTAGACAHWSFGKRMTCGLAQAIVAAYGRVLGIKSKHEILNKSFVIIDPTTKKSEHVGCQTLSGVAACAVNNSTALSVGFSAKR